MSEEAFAISWARTPREPTLEFTGRDRMSELLRRRNFPFALEILQRMSSPISQEEALREIAAQPLVRSISQNPTQIQ